MDDNLEKRMKRRSFLKKTVSFIGATAMAAYIGAGFGCKNNPHGPDPPPGPVTLQFEVYNHTQGYRTSFTRNTMSEQNVNIKISDLGYSDVDPQRIAVRQDNFGGLEVFSRTGEANFTAPRQNTNYDIILFNASNNAPYQWMDEKTSQLYQGTRNYTVYRKDFDGQTGPESVWADVFDQLNAALDVGFVKWGSISRQSTGVFSYGYGNSNDHAGWHAGSWITINAKIHPNEYTWVGLEEAFENICEVDDIGGNPSWQTIQANGVFNRVGEDLFAYTFAKDSAK